jgi:hypothetical protein
MYAFVHKKTTYTAESMGEVLQLMNDEELSVYKVNKQYRK